MVTSDSKYTNFITLTKQRYSVERKEYFLRSGSESLFVREVLPYRALSKHYVLFVHGLTFPSIADFDLPLKGHSMAGYLAQRGINTCLFDIRGYGKSSRPSRVSLEDRLCDLHRVYTHLLEQCGADSISLVGVSSGCNTIVDFLRTYPLLVPRDVVLLGPCYLRNDFISRTIEKLQLYKIGQLFRGKWKDPYVSFNRQSLRKRLVKGEDRIIQKSASAMFIEKAIELNPQGKEVLISPALPFFDACKRVDYMAPLFTVDHLKSPTLIVRGERDEICCKKSGVALYRELKNNGLHTEIFTHERSKHDMQLYKNCDALFSRIVAFLALKRGY